MRWKISDEHCSGESNIAAAAPAFGGGTVAAAAMASMRGYNSPMITPKAAIEDFLSQYYSSDLLNAYQPEPVNCPD